ncbi:hypothetical protein LZU85_00040 [Vibrio sp. IRLE0018]|uniref:DUF6795 domain-containing protein n=1 Tax=Vibrio floridensis TaxID=2908007 RepID=UPI001F2C495B|nr:DUF6795 domain-containing protein [Vibrio floridensis]MCF8777174.1 hypothetical protein [Vibrio floridensis]
MYRLFFILLTLSFQGKTDQMQSILSPEIRGKIVLNGESFSGLKIERTIIYNGVLTDEATTNEDGYFFFNSVEPEKKHKQSNLQDIRVQVIVRTNISNNDITIWQSKLHTFSPSNVIVASLGNLYCNLTNPLKVYTYSETEEEPVTNEVYSICDLEKLTFEELY